MLPRFAVPNPGPIAPPGLADIANNMLGWLKWGVIAAGVAGFLFCAFILIIGRRRSSAASFEGIIGSAYVLAGLALASVAALLVGAFQL